MYCAILRPEMIIARNSAAAEARSGWPAKGGGTKAVNARAKLGQLLWTADGERKLPPQDQLDKALGALREGDLAWICEFAEIGPLYLIPTRPWLGVLATKIRSLGAKRVLEVAAGDGFLSRSLALVAPDLEIIASDSGRWEDPRARMSLGERHELRDREVPGVQLGGEVLRLEARAAISRVKPDLVLAAWLPPGRLLDRLIAAPVGLILEVGAGSVTAGNWSWRFSHEICDGPIEELCRCRLDERPRKARHSRVTLYYAARHPEHSRERVRPGDWLWQFRP